MAFILTQHHKHHIQVSTRADYVTINSLPIIREDEQLVEGLVRQALSDRARLVRTVARRLAPGQPPVETLKGVGLPLLEGGGKSPSWSSVLVAAQVDPTLALRVVDVGPAADDVKASARFRAFWKDR